MCVLLLFRKKKQSKSAKRHSLILLGGKTDSFPRVINGRFRLVINYIRNDSTSFFQPSEAMFNSIE